MQSIAKSVVPHVKVSSELKSRPIQLDEADLGKSATLDASYSHSDSLRIRHVDELLGKAATLRDMALRAAPNLTGRDWLKEAGKLVDLTEGSYHQPNQLLRAVARRRGPDAPVDAAIRAKRESAFKALAEAEAGFAGAAAIQDAGAAFRTQLVENASREDLSAAPDLDHHAFRSVYRDLLHTIARLAKISVRPHELDAAIAGTKGSWRKQWDRVISEEPMHEVHLELLQVREVAENFHRVAAHGTTIAKIGTGPLGELRTLVFEAKEAIEPGSPTLKPVTARMQAIESRAHVHVLDAVKADLDLLQETGSASATHVRRNVEMNLQHLAAIDHPELGTLRSRLETMKSAESSALDDDARTGAKQA